MKRYQITRKNDTYEEILKVLYEKNAVKFKSKVKILISSKLIIHYPAQNVLKDHLDKLR